MKRSRCGTRCGPISSDLSKTKTCPASRQVSPCTSRPAGFPPTANGPKTRASTASLAIRPGKANSLRMGLTLFDGKRAKNSGFDGIIGKPPGEGFKPIRKEFAASFYRGKPRFSKMGMDGPTFDKWFADELKENKEFAARWREHEEYYERYKEFFGKRYVRQGTGDWNLFKLFIERDLSLVRQGGQFSLLVPSGFQTDEGCADLRRWFITEHRLDELTSFENKGWREVDRSEAHTSEL